MKKILDILVTLALTFGMTACGTNAAVADNSGTGSMSAAKKSETKPTSESTESTSEKGEKNQLKSGIEFDFETKTVTLNSGYEMPLYGLGTYRL